MRIAMMPWGVGVGAPVADPLSVPIGGVKAWAGLAAKAMATAEATSAIGSLMVRRTPVSRSYSAVRVEPVSS